jgi:hypothetical protein
VLVVVVVISALSLPPFLSLLPLSFVVAAAVAIVVVVVFVESSFAASTAATTTHHVFHSIYSLLVTPHRHTSSPPS